MQMGKRTHLRGHNASEILVRTKRWSHTRKGERVSESFEDDTSDEMVKYMSKLPGYLQGDESNVLNVGVLDWGRLEKWKHGRRAKRSGKREKKVSGTVVPNASSSQQYHHHRCKIDDQVHASSLLGKVKASRGLQPPSSHRLRCTLDPEFASSRDSLLYKQETATCSYNKSSGKSRRFTSGLLTEMGNSGGSLGAKGNLVVRDDTESEKRAAGEIHSQVATERASENANNKLDGEEETVGDCNAEKQENHQVSNIVLLRSRKQSRSTFSCEPHNSSLDDNDVQVTREVSRSLHFSDGISSSFDLGRDSEDMGSPLGVDLSCKKERFGVTRRHSKTASRILDQEDESRKKRHTSPSKRFSFSLGRLSRSFTLKEDSSSAGQPCDDTINKSDTMRFDGPSQSSNPEGEKHCGSRVSPLRRLLDHHPLLKSKGSEKNLLSTKERSTSPNPKPTNMDEKKPQRGSSRRTRALFQLTTRNGVPLFQFVVDDDDDNLNKSRSILGATMKHSAASSFKDDSVQYCTFYSVNEVVKKKRRGGSWLIHGHREKQQQQRGFVYTVIGQMRLCNSSMSSEITEKRSSSIIREAVLVDETEQVKGRKEVAAVVIKKKKKDAEENLNALEETTVIIPGGVHSFPEKGAPTPLVSRWRSGGCCDCGGWDVGCKLHVYLSNKTLHELDHQRFQLFAQEESDQDSGPVLTMTELKTGIYRVEFGSFLSHLQAFFVCVTVITCASEEETVSKTTGRSSSRFAPPLSPVGRV